MVVAVEEHAPDNLGQDVLGRAGDTRVVEQVALAVLGLGVDVGGQPSGQRLLQEAALRLQQLDAG